jgi:hypothetical protein
MTARQPESPRRDTRRRPFSLRCGGTLPKACSVGKALHGPIMELCPSSTRRLRLYNTH